MLEILRQGRDQHGFIGVKAEFEAEGTRIDELLRMLEITRRADLDVALKIGGCEAIRDLLEARQFGVEYIVAPMIESTYALKKFVDAKNAVYPTDEQSETKFLINLETVSAFALLDELVETGRSPGAIDGIVFGRADYTMSSGRELNQINHGEITKACIAAASSCAQSDLEFVVGGGVSRDALPELLSIAEVHLTRFETRKVLFDAGCLFDGDDVKPESAVGSGLLAAVRFEILWLMNKQDYYGRIADEDTSRIKMLTDRWGVLSGGQPL